ncbi:hypothetical protein [Cryobacterium breve]|uniref:hypothetical protein n=1 Tax=Cryobacterium breve TaxID=1259258 RepID=UPI0032B164AF
MIDTIRLGAFVTVTCVPQLSIVSGYAGFAVAVGLAVTASGAGPAGVRLVLAQPPSRTATAVATATARQAIEVREARGAREFGRRVMGPSVAGRGSSNRTSA